MSNNCESFVSVLLVLDIGIAKRPDLLDQDRRKRRGFEFRFLSVGNYLLCPAKRGTSKRLIWWSEGDFNGRKWWKMYSIIIQSWYITWHAKAACVTAEIGRCPALREQVWSRRNNDTAVNLFLRKSAKVELLCEDVRVIFLVERLPLIASADLNLAIVDTNKH